MPGCPALAHNTRCQRCESSHQRARNARRTEYRGDWPAFARSIVNAHIAEWGLFCPGYERDPHFVGVRSDLCADHRGDKHSRDPVDYGVLCRSCNGAKGGR